MQKKQAAIALYALCGAWKI